MLIAAPYLLGAWLLTVWITDGGPGWLNLLVLLFIWNALKFLVNGPITLIVLFRARLAERRDRRVAERARLRSVDPSENPSVYSPWASVDVQG